MKRLSIILSLLTWYVASAGLGLVWFSHAKAESDPQITSQVKGVSSASPVTVPTLRPYPAEQAPFPKIYSKEYVLYNAESGKVLTKSPTMSPLPIASTTKLMTAYLTERVLPLDTVVTVTTESVKQPEASSLMGLHDQEQTSVRNLLYGALLVSGNDAAYLLGETVGRTLLHNPQATSDVALTRFVTEMNAEAKRLGMDETKYMDPVGINDEGRSTALDLAKLMSKVEENASLQSIMTTATITIFDQSGSYRYDLRNSNRLVADYNYEGVLSGKTGFTFEAGHCMVTSARRNGITLIAAILHTTQDTNEASAVEARKLLDAGFNSIQWE